MNMFSDYPSLHPLAIHFPIVLILLAAAFQSIVVWKPQWIQIKWTTLIIMAAAFLSALAASTVFHAMLSPSAPQKSWAVFNDHEKYAQYTLWVSGLTLALKAIGDLYKIDKRSYHSIVLTSAVAAAIFLSIAGHHGARLVHIEGVGPMGKYLGTEEDEMNMENMRGMDNEKPDSTMKMDSTTMPAMDGMNNADTSKKDVKGMDMNQTDSKKNNMNDMKGMDMNGSKQNKRKDDMKGMDMNGSNSNKNKSNDMKGMDMKETDSTKNDMNDMKGMDMKGTDLKNKKTDDIKGMDMGDMKMNKKNPMDTIILYDNNPGRKRKKKNN